MAEQEIKWLHSNSLDNKDPDLDLGGNQSKFEIAINPMNNLFSDVKPSDATDGYIDYRCFYIANKKPDITYTNVLLTLTSDDLCSTIDIGSKLENDQQRITVFSTPDVGGYIILQTEFGSPFTCYWTGSAATFANEIQTKIRMTFLCDDVTVTYEGGPVISYLVEFAGVAQNRKVGLIQLLQNNFVSQQGPEYRVASYISADPFNGSGDTQVKVIYPIQAPDSGIVNVFNVSTDSFDHMNYISYIDDTFYLTTPLTTNLVPGDEVWVDLTTPQKTAVVEITKVTDGSPIQQIAEVIESPTDEPDWDEDNTLDVGTLLPGDSFFVWVKRDTGAGTPGCTGNFTITLTADES